ncbi:MAG: serine hydroxymethyltransferase [bacterium]
MNKLFELTQKEANKQRSTINLIASENYPSPKVLELLGSIWNDKYAEGYPHKRYYAGNVFADELEEFVAQKALEVFDHTNEYGVNVQVLSGSPANMMVYFTILEPGDTVLSLDLNSGGHLSHLHSTSALNKFYSHQSYSLNQTDNGFEIDMDDFKNKLMATKPRLVVIGFSAYTRQYDFAKLCEIAHANGALVLADIAHISGLVATGNHSSPFGNDGQGADFIMTTTHKTLRGPRSAMLFAKSEYMAAINRTVFPGTSGGPHLNQIAAVGQALLEVTGEQSYPDGRAFGDYITAVLDNTRALEAGLKSEGIEMVSDTQNHIVLIKLPAAADSLELQKKLESAGVLTNRNAIPGETKTPWSPSGLRLGAAAITSRGANLAQSHKLGELIGTVITGQDTNPLHKFATELSRDLSWLYQA